MTETIAFCKFCKKFHIFQDSEAHDEGVEVPLGVPVWEPLVIGINPGNMPDDRITKPCVVQNCGGPIDDKSKIYCKLHLPNTIKKCNHDFSFDELEKYRKWVDGKLTSETFSLDLLEKFVDHQNENDTYTQTQKKSGP